MQDDFVRCFLPEWKTSAPGSFESHNRTRRGRCPHRPKTRESVFFLPSINISVLVPPGARFLSRQEPCPRRVQRRKLLEGLGHKRKSTTFGSMRGLYLPILTKVFCPHPSRACGGRASHLPRRGRLWGTDCDRREQRRNILWVLEYKDRLAIHGPMKGIGPYMFYDGSGKNRGIK